MDFLSRSLRVGATKTAAGSGRVIPLNDRALMTLQNWATTFPDRSPEHFVLPTEHYGFSGDDCRPYARTIDPNRPAGEVKTGWEAAKIEAGVQCRFHDLRHTACTRLLERGAPLSVVASIMGWRPSTTAKMAKTYGHIGAEVQRAAMDSLVNGPQPRPARTSELTADAPDDTPHS